jgi:hypothetical protein
MVILNSSCTALTIVHGASKQGSDYTMKVWISVLNLPSAPDRFIVHPIHEMPDWTMRYRWFFGLAMK